MAATPETGFLVIADLTGYTAYLSRQRDRARAGDRRRPPRDDRRPPGAAVPAGEVRGRRGVPVRRGRARRRIAAPRRDRGILRRLPAAPAEHRPGDELRLQLVPAGAPARPQAVRPPWRRSSGAGSPVATSWPGRTSSSSTACSRGRRPPDARENGFALFTADAVAALGLDPAALGLRAARRRSSTSAGSTPSPSTSRLVGRPRPACAASTITEADVRPRLDTTIAAEPSVVWAHLTSPALRTLWEGPIVIDETSPGGRRGIGTTAQCVTGRLATLEEIVDLAALRPCRLATRRPGARAGRRHVRISNDDGGTRLRLRWAYLGDPPANEGEIAHPRRQGGRLRTARNDHRRRVAGRRP